MMLLLLAAKQNIAAQPEAVPLDNSVGRPSFLHQSESVRARGGDLS